MKERPVILAVDDEEKILDIVESYLEKSGWAALRAKNGGEALELLKRHPVDLVLLDLMLPDTSGEAVCRRIRAESDVPIIMLTARIDEASIVRGLSIGADDYVTKPFSPKQLVARIQAVLRRSGATGKGGKFLTAGELAVDMENRSVRRNGQPLSLTPNQYKILTLLMGRPEKIFTRDEIIENVKDDDFDGFDRAIDTHIKNLRQKLGDDPKAPTYIITVYGVGYRFGLDKTA
jgi:DNA-binding response OmpR family regulator